MKTRLRIFPLCVLLLIFPGIALTPSLSQAAPAPGAAPAEIVTNGPYGGTIIQLANDPASSAGLYAAVKQVGLFHTADRGQTWSFLFSGIGHQGNFAIDAVDTDLLYATYQQEGLYRSRDAGATWQAIPLSGQITRIQSVRAFAHPTVSETVFAALSFSNREYECGDQCGLYRSLDAGDTWTWIGASLPADAEITALAFLPGSPSVLYAGADDGKLYRSADGGDSWAYQDQPLSHVSDMRFSPSGALYVMGSGEGVALPMVRCVENAGALDCRDALDEPSYVVIDPATDIMLGSNEVTDLKINPDNASDLLASTGYRIARSLDGGATWTFYDHISGPSQPSAVAFDLGQSNVIYAGSDEGVWKTGQADVAPTDYDTAAWADLNNLLTGVVPALIIPAPSDPQVIYVNANSGMYRTADGAATWERLPMFCEDDTWCYHLNSPFAVDPQDADKLVWAAWNYTMHLSDDGGQSWSVVTGLPKPTGLPALTEGKEYVISIHALSAIPGPQTAYIAAVAFHDPDKPDFKVFAGGGIYKSVDGGAAWTIQAQSGSQALSSVAYDPTDPDRLYAGGCTLAADGSCEQAVVLASDDRGDNWAPFTPADPVLQQVEDANVLAVRPADGRVYVVHGNGLVWIDKSDHSWTHCEGGPDLTQAIVQILFDPAPLKAKSVMYAASPQGLFVSSMSGDQFAPFDGPLGSADASALAAAHNAAGENFIFVGTAGGQFNEGGMTLRGVAQTDSLVEAGVYRMESVVHYSYVPIAIR